MVGRIYLGGRDWHLNVIPRVVTQNSVRHNMTRHVIFDLCTVMSRCGFMSERSGDIKELIHPRPQPFIPAFSDSHTGGNFWIVWRLQGLPEEKKNGNGLCPLGRRLATVGYLPMRCSTFT
jgi:hypothetical protein